MAAYFKSIRNNSIGDRLSSGEWVDITVEYECTDDGVRIEAHSPSAGYEATIDPTSHSLGRAAGTRAVRFKLRVVRRAAAPGQPFRVYFRMTSGVRDQTQTFKVD